MTQIRAASRTLVMLSVCLLAVGLWQIGEGSWIYAKARLAQYLLQRAWSHTLAGQTDVRPWPWADTYPVARLMAPSMHVDLIVLNGSYGRTMAFGPGYAESSALPGSPGTTILTGHRDTHFRFLRRLKRQDEIVIETVRRTSERYLVHSTQIVDARTASITLTGETDQVALVTCYPFDTVMTGGPLRYVVTAIRVPSALPRSIDRRGGRIGSTRGISAADLKHGPDGHLPDEFLGKIFGKRELQQAIRLRLSR